MPLGSPAAFLVLALAGALGGPLRGLGWGGL